MGGVTPGVATPGAPAASKKAPSSVSKSPSRPMDNESVKDSKANDKSRISDNSVSPSRKSDIKPIVIAQPPRQSNVSSSRNQASPQKSNNSAL